MKCLKIVILYQPSDLTRNYEPFNFPGGEKKCIETISAISQKYLWVSTPVVLLVKYLSANARDLRDAGSIARSGRSPGEGHGNTYSCLENPMDRGAWCARAHRVAQSRT